MARRGLGSSWDSAIFVGLPVSDLGWKKIQKQSDDYFLQLCTFRHSSPFWGFLLWVLYIFPVVLRRTRALQLDLHQLCLGFEMLPQDQRKAMIQVVVVLAIWTKEPKLWPVGVAIWGSAYTRWVHDFPCRFCSEIPGSCLHGWLKQTASVARTLQPTPTNLKSLKIPAPSLIIGHQVPSHKKPSAHLHWHENSPNIYPIISVISCYIYI
jgi:hypothetical protein